MPRQQQQTGYQPYPIYDLDAGLNLARQPWLIPVKAFSGMLNFHVSQGVLRKRRGYQKFSEMVHQVLDEVQATGDGTTTEFTFTVSNTPMRHSLSSAYFKIKADALEVVEDEYDEENNTSTLKGDGTGTVDWGANEVSVTFDSAPGDGSNITLDYEYKPGLPITGIYSYWSGQGDEQLMFFNTKRVNVYFPATGLTRDIVQEDKFDGEPTDYLFAEVWAGGMYITNNKDPVYKFDGEYLTELSTDIDGNGNNDMSQCHLIFSYKSRLIFLRPTEFGVTQAQRARWTAPGTDDDFEGGGYIDAPALDWIMGADFIADRLIVFFERSIWALNYIGDTDNPFVWEKLIDTEGCSAPMSTAPFANEIFTLGPTEFLACDGITTEKLDTEIPDYPLNFDQELYDKVYGAVLEEESQIWWNYPEPDDTYPTKQLVYNYKNRSWSVFDARIQAVGYYREIADFTWEQIDLAWDDIDWAWDEKEAQAGYPTTLGGKQDGTVVVLNRTGADMGEAIEAMVRTKAMNPFVEASRSVRLGYLDIYYDVDPDLEIEVRFYEYDSEDPYLTTTISLDGRSGISKDFKRIAVNCTAKFHIIEIRNNQKIAPLRIHAIVPWMRPGGRIWGAV